jgi:nucleotide-binding universal stress UspA family protein
MYQKILAPLDGSEFSECALGHVRAVATGCQVPELVLLRVIEPIRQAFSLSEDLLREIKAEAQASSEEYVAKVADDLKKVNIVAKTVITSGDPAETILDYAKQNQVDLIIMSTHGRSGITRWTFGSVADRVLRHSIAPVLLASPAACRVG